MAKHTLWCSHYGVDVPQLNEIICNVCGSSWPCPSRKAYDEELMRRHMAKTKAPDRLVRGAHAATGGSALDKIGD